MTLAGTPIGTAPTFLAVCTRARNLTLIAGKDTVVDMDHHGALARLVGAIRLADFVLLRGCLGHAGASRRRRALCGASGYAARSGNSCGVTA